MLNSSKNIPSLKEITSDNIVSNVAQMLFEDIDNAEDGTLIVYYIAEVMKYIHNPQAYYEQVEVEDIKKGNLYFDFNKKELVDFCKNSDSESSVSLFRKNSILLSTTDTNIHLLNIALEKTAIYFCKKYRDNKPKSEWDECFFRPRTSRFKNFLLKLKDEVYDNFNIKLKETVFNHLSGLKILLEEYSGAVVNDVISYSFIDCIKFYDIFTLENELSESLSEFLNNKEVKENPCVVFNPEIIGLNFVIKKVTSEYKNSKGYNSNANNYISFLLNDVISLEDFISSVSDGESFLFNLVVSEDSSKFIQISKEADIGFFVKKVRDFLLNMKNLNLEDLALQKVAESNKESGLVVLLRNINLVMNEYNKIDINNKIIENLLVDNPISKDDIDHLIKSLTKIQLLIWNNKVILPDIVTENYELAILSINNFLHNAKDIKGIDKELLNYFQSKFINIKEKRHYKQLKTDCSTIVNKLILDTEEEEIFISLRILSYLASKNEEFDLLNSNSFIPNNKKIILYDLPKLNFDDNLMISLSRLPRYFNQEIRKITVDYKEDEFDSWVLLSKVISGGHLDFNKYTEEAKSTLESFQLILK